MWCQNSRRMVAQEDPSGPESYTCCPSLCCWDAFRVARSPLLPSRRFTGAFQEEEGSLQCGDVSVWCHHVKNTSPCKSVAQGWPASGKFAARRSALSGVCCHAVQGGASPPASWLASGGASKIKGFPTWELASLDVSASQVTAGGGTGQEGKVVNHCPNLYFQRKLFLKYILFCKILYIQLWSYWE